MEISKEIMYRYLYMVLKPVFGARLKVLYTDTDSLIISLRSSDEKSDMNKISDTLNYESKLFKFKVNSLLLTVDKE